MFIYIAIFYIIAVAFLDLFSNNPYSMTKTNTLMQNWQHKDISFKQLIDFGFPLPQYEYENSIY